MATPQSKKPENRIRKKKKPSKKFRLTYSLGLLAVMLVVGGVSALFAYNFGKQALEGVNSSPAGIKLPKVNPNPKDTSKPEAKPSPVKQSDGKDFLLDESQIIAEFRARSQQELGDIRRPAFVASASADRRAYTKTYVKVDRAYTMMRDPLAISASADQRIADRIAELRQRVYVSSRSYDSGTSFSNSDRMVAPVVTKSVTIDKPLTIQSDFRQEQLKPRKEIVDLMPSDMDISGTEGRR